jgi:CDP-paratose 2-epimerase
MSKKILITGGAGFIGATAASFFSNQGYEVVIFDNLSRKGSQDNLQRIARENIFFIKGCIEKKEDIARLFESNSFDYILHLAGQVAVTTSIAHPEEDFFTNAYGTLNILEAIRKYSPESILIYSSTNKVYGKLEHLNILELPKRYLFGNGLKGVSEGTPLSFYSPYGCSKGAADQYVLDYAKNYGLKASVFRQSCIYGENQFGIEDQGWVAWFTIAALLKKPISVFGDGKQVRDLLYVDDLVNAYHLGFLNPDKITSKAFNIGGGPENSLSLLELLEWLDKKIGSKVHYQFALERPGDQKVYISNINNISEQLDWRPMIDVNTGLDKLFYWTDKHLEKIKTLLSKT